MSNSQALAKVLKDVLTNDYRVSLDPHNDILVNDTFGNTIDVIVLESSDKEAANTLQERLNRNQENQYYSVVVQARKRRKRIPEMDMFSGINPTTKKRTVDHRKIKMTFNKSAKELSEIVERTDVDWLSEAEDGNQKLIQIFDGKKVVRQFMVERVQDEEDKKSLPLGDSNENGFVGYAHKLIENPGLNRNLFMLRNTIALELRPGEYDKLAFLVPRDKSTYQEIMREEGVEKNPFPVFESEPNQHDRIELIIPTEEIKEEKKTEKGYTIHSFNHIVASYISKENAAKDRIKERELERPLRMEERNTEFSTPMAYKFAIMPYVEELEQIQAYIDRTLIKEYNKIVTIPDHPSKLKAEKEIILPKRDEFLGDNKDFIGYLQEIIEDTMLDYIKLAKDIKSGLIVPKEKSSLKKVNEMLDARPNPDIYFDPSPEQRTKSESRLPNYFGGRPEKRDIHDFEEGEVGYVDPLLAEANKYLNPEDFDKEDKEELDPWTGKPLQYMTATAMGKDIKVPIYEEFELEPDYEISREEMYEEFEYKHTYKMTEEDIYGYLEDLEIYNRNSEPIDGEEFYEDWKESIKGYDDDLYFYEWDFGDRFIYNRHDGKDLEDFLLPEDI